MMAPLAAWFGLTTAVLAVEGSSAPALHLAAGGTPYPGDLGQAVAALIIFVLLFLVLRKFAWKPIAAQLKRREEDIASKIDDAQKREAKAKELAREYQEQLDHIESRQEEALTAARQEAESEKQQILEGAKEEARQALQRATEEIEAACDKARRDLSGETAQMAASMAEEVLREKLTEEDHRRLVEESTQRITEEVRRGR
jgi:F-type H+-transporting ATPase subunit b